MAQQENKNQLQIQLRPEIADGKYSNLAMIGHGPNEFLMDFIFAAGGEPHNHEPGERQAADVCPYGQHQQV